MSECGRRDLHSGKNASLLDESGLGPGISGPGKDPPL